ncbi:hypothetical protein PSEUBRA_004249 [Kalmanozyma brasiliensis GHG001]|uniref:uncharacterized protein n=1 Tax=Kalmanozyma brasiliensis (strain GHG001) TaxID=1365824 RepID=UPI002867DFB1|nr:uncharacterized protein PSEUBRA_004249 [Kalmanozyma brasiliensis GHG001]KAF6767360.1 hypothetical protein PSEUBRA_004249 [Kalmanozyma brasiliensis GHG001]
MHTIFRRAFTSRSAIRAPPAPSSSLPISAAHRSIARAGRVAMLPKASESSAIAASASPASTFATSASEQNVLPEVGSISVPGEQPNVLRVGESA